MDFKRIKSLPIFSTPRDEGQARARKRYLRIGGITLAVLFLILIVLPFLIDVDRFRPQLESSASAAFGRQITMGHLSLSILSGRVRADQIAIADDPAFSASPFVTAKSLRIGVELMPLIFSRQLNVTNVTLEEPQITLLKSATGKWNFSSLGAASAQKAPESEKGSETTAKSFTVAKLHVAHGRLSVGKADPAAKRAVYENVDITMSEFSFTSQFPFRLTAQLPNSGDVNVSGKAGPINADDASRTPLEVAVKANNATISTLGIIDPASGIAGVVDLDETLNSDGTHGKLVGLLTGKQLKLSRKGSPAPKTVAVTHAIDLDLIQHTANVTQGDVAIGSAQAHLTGTLHSQDNVESVNLKLDAPSMPVDELVAMLPALGIVLPSGAQLRGGTLSTELAITGPLANLVIIGPVRLSNTQLTNFDLGSRLGTLAAFAGKEVSNPNTSIQNASLDARVSQEGKKADNINITVPAIGVFTGAGTVSPEGALAFHMSATLHGGLVGGLAKIEGARTGKNGIPFAIEGTTSNPKFVPETGGLAQSLVAHEVGNVAKGKVPGQSTISKGVSGLLGHKKN
jgi:AsmA protein